ncbi:MAG: aldehyde dehydrogenase family protein [Alphaproteobacteria bacterium]|nr:aldehyde dehydrogenase family protein [Alphaproteobacteria bacterium]
MKAVNPANGELVGSYPELTPGEVGKKIDNAARAFRDWAETPIEARAALLPRLAEVLERHKERYATLMTVEMGKPIQQSRGEIEKCAWLCRFYAEHGPGFLEDEVVKTEAHRAFVSFRPLGVVLAVMPWNFPFWQVLRFAVPGMLAGNAALLKHASNVPGCALAIEEALREAGLPDGVFQTLLIPSGMVGGVIEHKAVRAVTLTGSNAAGRAIASQAGGCLKKSVLELGGSDPFVVLEDADLDKAAEAGAASRLFNTGQACIAAKRFIVVDGVAEAFQEKLAERLKARKMGDPMDENTAVGALARADLRDDLHEQVERSLEKGARSVLGGVIPNDEGAYYPATILTGVHQGMPAFDEELFGPVASLITAKDEAEALDIANNSPFGLGANVFTEDLERGQRIARDRFEAGVCFVNDFVKSDPRLPFGGIKESGYGRELGIFGIREFTNVKTVVVA